VQQLHLLAILRAVERRIEQFQLSDGKASESAEQQSPFDETICGEEDLFRSNPRNLKLVMLFDPRDESYGICSHNLSAEGARQKLDELRAKVFSPSPSVNPRIVQRTTPMTARRVGRNSHGFSPRAGNPQG